MADNDATELPDPTAVTASGVAAGAGMAAFVRVPGLPDAICVELPPDATVADLRDGARALAEGRPVGRLRYAGEVLTDDSVTLADAGIGPQAVVDAEPLPLITFAERWRYGSGDSYSFADRDLPVSVLEGVTVTGATPQQSRFLDTKAYVPDGEVPLFVEDAPAEAVAAGIRPGLLLRLRQTGYPTARVLGALDPETANAKIQQLPADPSLRRNGIKCITVSVPPAVTLAVAPDTTLKEALLQVSRAGGFTLSEDAHIFSVGVSHGGEDALRPLLDPETLCGDIDLPEDGFIMWEPERSW
eukprot:TRINITY_DN20800_c0_g3_i5.p1 TRINITY_DN20800_c0_g3~~TRINITY_DN20800_c0_g3_i5.p1  ORF type:complete len:300 (+),score=28.15 TRINITY_DN20800_c0_g3_i5:111-1010(+)